MSFKSYCKEKLRCWIFGAIPELRRLLRATKWEKHFFETDFNQISGENKEYPARIYAPYRISHSEIGEFSYVASGSSISHTRIGRFCSIGHDFICGLGQHPVDGMSTCPMFFSPDKQNGYSLSEGSVFKEHAEVRIGHDVWIGARVTVLDGVRIGNGAIVGAGSVVTKDIPEYAVACGVPARVIRRRFTSEQIDAFKSINWYDWDFEKLNQVEEHFFDVEAFLHAHLKKGDGKIKD